MKYFAFILLYAGLFYLSQLYTYPFWIEFMLKSISKHQYIDDLTESSRAAGNVVLISYGFISFFWNKSTLTRIGKTTKIWWIVNWIIDYFSIPLSIFILVLYNNTKPTAVNLSSLDNMLLVWFLMSVKHLIILMKEGKMAFGRNRK